MKKFVKFEFSIYDSNETRAPIANPPNSAQLEDTPTIPPTPSYIRVRAGVSGMECGEGQTTAGRHADGGDQYTFRLG